MTLYGYTSENYWDLPEGQQKNYFSESFQFSGVIIS